MGWACNQTPHCVTTNVATGRINPRKITLSLPNNLRNMDTEPVNGYLISNTSGYSCNSRVVFGARRHSSARVPYFRDLPWHADLSEYSDEEIKGAVVLRVVFLLLKHIFSSDLPEKFPGILGLLKDLLNKRNGLEYLETVLRYVSFRE